MNKIFDTGEYQLKYEVENNEITITGYEGDLPAELTIPDTIDGIPVTSIGDRAFSGCASLTSVNMPNVISIGKAAFWECEMLTSVDMPNVTNIGYDAFHGCTALTSITMPNVTSIDDSAFSGCSSLVEFGISSDNSYFPKREAFCITKIKQRL